MGIKPPSWMGVPDPVPTVAPTEAEGVAPSSSAPSASVGGPELEEQQRESDFAPGVQSPADYRTTALKTQTGILSLGRGESAKYEGRVGTDVQKMRDDLKDAKLKQLQREFVAKWERGADADELKQLQSEARVWASEQVAAKFLERRNMGGNELFIDIDPKGRIDALSQWAEDSFVGKALAPLWAAGTGIDVEFRETNPEDPDQPERITYNEGDAWGSFDWLTRMTPMTQVALAARAADERSKAKGGSGVEAGPVGLGLLAHIPELVDAWGSEEHITKIMEGRDLISEADELNLAPVPDAVSNTLGKYTGIEWLTGMKGEQVADYSTALLMSFLDPDVFTLVGPAADLTKAVGKGVAKTEAGYRLASAIPGTTAWTDTKIEMFQGTLQKAEDELTAALDSGMDDAAAVAAADKVLYEAGLGENPLRAHVDFLVASRVRKGTPRSTQAQQAMAARERLLEAYRQEYGEESAIYQAVLGQYAEASAETGKGGSVLSAQAKAKSNLEGELEDIRALKAQKAEEIATLEKEAREAKLYEDELPPDLDDAVDEVPLPPDTRSAFEVAADSVTEADRDAALQALKQAVDSGEDFNQALNRISNSVLLEVPNDGLRHTYTNLLVKAFRETYPDVPMPPGMVGKYRGRSLWPWEAREAEVPTGVATVADEAAEVAEEKPLGYVPPWAMEIEGAPTRMQMVGLLDITPRQARDLHRALAQRLGDTRADDAVGVPTPRTITGRYMDWNELSTELARVGWPKRLETIREDAGAQSLDSLIGRPEVDLASMGVPEAAPGRVDLKALGVRAGVLDEDLDELVEGYTVAPFEEQLRALQAEDVPLDWRDLNIARRKADALVRAPDEAAEVAETSAAVDARIQTLRDEITGLVQKEADVTDRIAALDQAKKAVVKRKAGALSKTPIPANDLEAAVGLTAKQIHHYEAAADYFQLAGLRQMLDKFTGGVSAAARTSRVAKATPDTLKRVDEIDTEMGTLLEDLVGARQQHAVVPPVDEALPHKPLAAMDDAAVGTYNEKIRKLQMLAEERTRLIGSANVEALGSMEAAAKTRMEGIKTDLDAALKEIEGRKGLAATAKKAQALHLKEVKKLEGEMAKIARDRVVGEFKRALQETSASFDALKTGEQGSDLASQIMRTSLEGWTVFDDWGPARNPLKPVFAWPVRAMSHIMDPAKALFNTKDPEIAQIAVNGTGSMKYTLGELTDVATQFDDPLDRIKAVMKFITDAETPLPKKDGATTSNTGALKLDGTHANIWEDATPILAHLSKTQKGGTSDVPKAVMALARMFAEGPLKRTMPLGAKLVNRALKQSGGNIDEFMGIMQRAGGSGFRRNRIIDPDEPTKIITKVVKGEVVEKVVDNWRYQTLDEAMASYRSSEFFSEGAFARKLEEEAKAARILTTAAVHARTLKEVSDEVMVAALKKVALTTEGGELLAENSKEGRAALQRAVYSMTAMADPTKTDPSGYRDALALFEALGMRGDQLKIILNKKEALAGAVSVSNTAVIPRAVLQEMEKDLGKLVKTFDLFTAPDLEPIHGSLARFARGFGHLYSTSLVTGLIFPKLAHGSAIMFGNFGQVWAEEGLSTAAKTQTQSIKNFAPAITRLLPGGSRKVREGMAKSLGVPVGNVLPTATDVILNPDIGKFMDPALAPASTKIELPDGTTMTMGELRTLARKSGVFSSFISTTGLQDALYKFNKRSGWGKALNTLQVPKQTYADIADAFEQRQRVAMFLDLVTRKGVSPEDAARRTRNALYDWNYPMTAFEKEILSQAMMFWTFQRKAMGQSARILMQPFTSTKVQNMGGFAARSLGQEASGFGNLKDMAKTVNTVQEAQRDAAEDDVYKQVYPWWAMRAGSREWMYTERMDPNFAASIEAATGRKVTHEAYTLPSFTPLEMANTYFSLIKAAVAAETVPHMVIDPAKEFLVSGGGRVTGPAMEAAIDALTGRQEEQWLKTGVNEYAIVDRKVIGGLNMIGLLEATNDAKTGGAVRLSPSGQAAYALMTPLSYETIQFFEPLAEAGAYEQTIPQAVVRAMRQYSGIYKSYYYDPAKIKEGDVKAVDKYGGAMEREVGRQDTFTLTQTPPTFEVEDGRKGKKKEKNRFGF